MEIMSVKQAAEATGMSCSYWRQKIFRKEIRFVKLGRRVLIPKATVEQMLNDSIVEPKASPELGLSLFCK